MHGLRRRQRTEHRGKFAFQFGGRLEASVGGQIVLEKAIDRAGYVAADRIQCFVLAAEAVRAASVDHHYLRLSDLIEDEARIDGVTERRAVKSAWSDFRRLRGDRQFVLAPRVPAAVEYCGARVADPTQHPPQPRGIEAARGIVGDSLPVVTHAECRQPRAELRRIGQGVTAVGA